MDIGSMRQRITLQEHKTVVDGIGNHISKWVDFHSCFAYVNLASGNENGTQPAVRSEDILTFIIRWCKKLENLNSKEYRISFGGHFYNITCVDDVQFGHRKLKMTGKKIVRE